MIGGVLVEKDLDTVKKDLEAQIINVNKFTNFYNRIIFKRLKKYLKLLFFIIFY